MGDKAEAVGKKRNGRWNGNLSERVGHTLRLVQFVWITMLIAWSITMTFITQVVCWIVLFPVLIVDLKFRTVLMGRLIRFYSVTAAFYLNPTWGVKVVREAPKGFKPRDTLIMVNHASAVDAWVVAKATFPWELKYVFKSQMYKIPIAGWALWLGHDIPIYFTRDKGGWGTEKGSVALTMDRVKELQAMGVGQVIFPEGTRSKSGRIQLFKDGFFRFAVENECEILPCVTHNTPSLWPMGSSLYGCGTAYFAFGDPIRVNKGEFTVESLKSTVRSQMVELLKCCPLHNPEEEATIDELPAARGLGIRGAAVKD